MTEEEQEARSMKWERGASSMLRQLSTGNFALYPCGGIGSPYWIGPAEELLTAYANRPAPSIREHIPTENRRAAYGINLSTLEINI